MSKKTGELFPFFHFKIRRRRLSVHVSETHQDAIVLNEVDSAAVEALIDFCYTGSIVVEITNVQVLLPAACLLQIEEVGNEINV